MCEDIEGWYPPHVGQVVRMPYGCPVQQCDSRTPASTSRQSTLKGGETIGNGVCFPRDGACMQTSLFVGETTSVSMHYNSAHPPTSRCTDFALICSQCRQLIPKHTMTIRGLIQVRTPAGTRARHGRTPPVTNRWGSLGGR
eukprot:1177749-Prorocentrum_minimum.AAC.2